MRDLGHLPTEQRNPRSMGLDRLSALELVDLFREEDQRILEALEAARPALAQAMELAAETFRKGGRLFYVGAGTSGRLGTLDASECPPTFGVERQLVQGIIAGGWRALMSSREGAEDRSQDAVEDLRARGVRAGDLVLGIAASGTTPYVHGALEYAHGLPARTGLITCHPKPETDLALDVIISLPTGPELLTGSTRMKAGSATKLTLNVITTGAMVLLGKVHENLMVDLQPRCAKLVDRAERIFMNICQTDRARARTAVAAAGDLKTALVAELGRVSVDEARAALQQHGGVVSRAVQELGGRSCDNS